MIALVLFAALLASTSCHPIGASKMQRSLAMTRRGASAGLLSVVAVSMLPVDKCVADVMAGAPLVAVAESDIDPPKIEASKWSGAYLDPLHPRGSFKISQKGTTLTITGRDEPRGKPWTIHGVARGNVALIDFSPMGGRVEETATLKDGSCITFTNGYKWSKQGVK